MTLIRSWLAAANDPACPFPLNNLPCGVFSTPGTAPRCGVAIGDSVLDVAGMEKAGLLRIADAPLLNTGAWNPLMAAGPAVWERLRSALMGHLREGADTRDQVEAWLQPLAGVTLHLPFAVTEYTDFYAGRNHAFNVGTMFRGAENALPPNWLHIPIGYNGRASSVVVSGTPVRRPRGQILPQGAKVPVYQATQMLDYEVELGLILRGGNAQGQTIAIDHADDAIFGVCLLNDWSARDIQRWENLPLGPFLSKSFATSIGPWIVTSDALRPFRRALPPRAEDLPQPPDHLNTRDLATWAIQIDTELQTAAGARGRLARSEPTDMHWSPAQMVTHHASNGCPLWPGDLLGSGTISGAAPDSLGCLLELTEDGRRPVAVGDERRGYLLDGDRVTMTGWCRAEGARAIGLGQCEGRIEAA